MEIEQPIRKISTEESEDDEKPLEIKFVFNSVNEKYCKSGAKLESELIILGMFGHASAYLSLKLPTHIVKVATFSNEDRKTVPVVEVYYNEEHKTTFVIFVETIPDAVYTEFAKIFFSHFEGHHVILLDAIHYAKFNPFNVSSDEKYPQLRYVLSTKAMVLKEIIEKYTKRLENGKNIHGIIAEMMIHCELNKIPAEVHLLIFQEYHIGFDDLVHYELLTPRVKALHKELLPKDIGSVLKNANKKLFSKSLYV